MSLKQLLANQIQSNRAKLSASSVKTYVSILSSLHKSMNASGDSIEWFSDHVDDIIKHLENKGDVSKKTILSALYVLTGDDKYREIMMKTMKIVNDRNKEQKMSPTQSENWISTDKVKSVYDDLHEKAMKMLSKKSSILDESVLMEFLLVAVLSGQVIPPRRSLDYALMKIRNYDVKTDNYFKGNKFYFNKYKTSDTYGLQVIDLPPHFCKMLRQWIKINQTDFLLYGSTKQRLTSLQINRVLNKAFNGKVSTNLLRHIYLSNIYKDIPAISEMDELAREMGHSRAQAMEYIKR
jgi:hypothetical protein